MEALYDMKVKVLMILVAAFTLLAVSAMAQQDPLDAGAADSLILSWVHTPDVENGDSLVIWELTSLSDVLLGSLGSGFEWNTPNLVLDSAVIQLPFTVFDFIRIVYYQGSVENSNINRRFLCTLGRIQGTGLAAGRTTLAIYYGHVTSFEPSDMLEIDTASFSALSFVEGQAPEYAPRYSGKIQFAYPAGVNINGNGSLPTNFDLGQNYPNPFNPQTEIPFDLPVKAQTSLEVYNVLGQKVATLIDAELPADHYTVTWDGTSDQGNKVASGIYFYRIAAGDKIETKKMMMLK
jgi:hypothetical protein